MVDYVLNSKLWVKRFDVDCSPRGRGLGNAELLGEATNVSLTCLNPDIHPFINSMFKHHLTADLRITFHGSDIDEARRLLSAGHDKMAISKALDILERLDK